MRHRWWLYGFKIAALVLVVIAALSAVIMDLWNWLIPELVGWHTINFWQALGLLVLTRILFGGWRRPGYAMHWRHRMMERWEQMTPEERAKFRAGMQSRCGRAATPPEQTQA